MKNIIVNNDNKKNYYRFIDGSLIVINHDDLSMPINQCLKKYFGERNTYRIFVPSILSIDSACSYDGVTFSLWIFMYLIRENICDFTIVLLGSETRGAFYDHCEYANILKAPNVYYVQNTKNSIEKFLERMGDKNSLYKMDILIESLKMVHIIPPSSYKSSHTITNEWCIYRWSQTLGLEGIKTPMEDSLYFAYIKTITPLYKTEYKGHISVDAKVLVVDDEMDKGWKEFWTTLLRGSDVKCIGSNFKKYKNAQLIIDEIEKDVKSYDPDVVILDLRLHENDHDSSSNLKISGINALIKIKQINQGIQVIGFTASNKVWNLLEWQKCGIDGFITKESPDLSQTSDYTNKTLKLLSDEIQRCAERKYLKDFYIQNEKNKEILKNLRKNHVLDKICVDDIVGYLDEAFKALSLRNSRFDLAFMFCFLIVEEFSNIIIDVENPEPKGNGYIYKFRRNSETLKKYDSNGHLLQEQYIVYKVSDKGHCRIDYSTKIYNIMNYAGVKNYNLSEIVKLRNGFNHPNPNEQLDIQKKHVSKIFYIVSGLISNYK